MWPLLLVPLSAFAVFALVQRLERAETERQLRRWADSASADELFAELRPTLVVLAVNVPALVEPLLAVPHWTLRDLRDALRGLEAATAQHGFCTGDIRAWQNSWFFESRVRDVLAALDRRA